MMLHFTISFNCSDHSYRHPVLRKWECEKVECIHVAQYRVWWWDVVNVVVNMMVHKEGDFLTTWAPFSFSCRSTGRIRRNHGGNATQTEVTGCQWKFYT
jgi:hypothetical protein